MAWGLFKSRPRRKLYIWTDPPAYPSISTPDLIGDIHGRWDAYGSAKPDMHITEHDDMLGDQAGAVEAYNQVGLSALQIITEAMVASGRSRFASILDLPCGGGRVTRHLRAFFPESRLFVADIDKTKEAAVAAQFSAERFDVDVDYIGTPATRFDLIFSGSLLTHFDITMFDRALAYFIAALNPGGLAVLTLHGRNSASHALAPATFPELLKARDAFAEHRKSVKFKTKTNFDPEPALKIDFMRSRFGYFANPAWTALYGRSYGGSYTSPSWIVNRIESKADCRILGFKEISYGNNQDVIILQKI